MTRIPILPRGGKRRRVALRGVTWRCVVLRCVALRCVAWHGFAFCGVRVLCSVCACVALVDLLQQVAYTEVFKHMCARGLASMSNYGPNPNPIQGNLLVSAQC